MPNDLSYSNRVVSLPFVMFILKITSDVVFFETPVIPVEEETKEFPFRIIDFFVKTPTKTRVAYRFWWAQSSSSGGDMVINEWNNPDGRMTMQYRSANTWVDWFYFILERKNDDRLAKRKEVKRATMNGRHEGPQQVRVYILKSDVIPCIKFYRCWPFASLLPINTAGATCLIQLVTGEIMKIHHVIHGPSTLPRLSIRPSSSTSYVGAFV